MTPALALAGASLPPTPPDALNSLMAAQEWLRTIPQISVITEHVLHAGMYVRTIRIPAGTVVCAALIKIPTVLVLNGNALVFVGQGWIEVSGYKVMAASAGRKQLCIAKGPVEATMIFPTQAKTVEEAEREFTDESELLMSRTEDNIVTITGE